MEQMKKVWLNTKDKKHKVLLPGLDFFVDQIKESKPFVYEKVNHGWWECIVKAKDDPSTSFADIDATLIGVGRGFDYLFKDKTNRHQ